MLSPISHLDTKTIPQSYPLRHQHDTKTSMRPVECPVWRRILRVKLVSFGFNRTTMVTVSRCVEAERWSTGCGCRLHRRWLRTSWWRELWAGKQSSPFTRQSQRLSTLAPVTSSEAMEVRSQLRDGERRDSSAFRLPFFLCVCGKARSSADVAWTSSSLKGYSGSLSRDQASRPLI